ncbi:flagellar basal body-associated protein FliL [Nitrosomonas sp. Nm166]|uniref:flagellar basal body-associated protein FliL n=1 Tax=Nitrosomonas sp. Nm166 TaxID=1881054 RepID=UPI0008EBD6D4|nr:flagellar basal body-associated protein FliL [Nitrosomonas sp. Nm166]SFE99064.1 flagellar FliL protein [Nitrosomonas sp. Nm166]
MSRTIETSSGADGKKNKKSLLIIILIAIIAIGAGTGGTWYAMKRLSSEESGPEKLKEKPTAFIDLDIFTVNLLPEENNQYLQVGLTAKTRETPVIAEIKKQMPDIRNRILMLLSSQKAANLASITGKQQLSRQIVDEIKQSLSSVELREDVLEVLFTSFVIQ